MFKRVWFLCSVWPEPNSSAAGVRDYQILRLLKEFADEVLVHSPSEGIKHEALLREGNIRTLQIPANNAAFDQAIREFSPDLVIYDRFLMEEQFGWRVRENAPQAVEIIDSQDLHCLRKGRQANPNPFTADWCVEENTFLRELASFHRVDAVWVVSDAEINMLIPEASLPEHKIFRLGFMYEAQDSKPTFQASTDLLWIGNFRHAPNRDSFFWLAESLWEKIRAVIPGVSVYVYGAYPPREVMDRHHPEKGFHVLGPAPSLDKVFSGKRLSLAPLRFGAGIKGKIAESWQRGIPVAGTAIAYEGMRASFDTNAINPDLATEEDYCSFVSKLYCDKELWNLHQASGLEWIANFATYATEKNRVLEFLSSLYEKKQNAKLKQGLFQRILLREENQSTRYLGRYLELKGGQKH